MKLDTKMDIDKLVETLHPLERQVLSKLDKISILEEVSEATGLEGVKVMRAFQWLQNKGIIVLKEDLKDVIDLDVNGKVYLKKGLPEHRFLKAISEKAVIEEIENTAGLSKEEVNICIGVLKGKAAIEIIKDKKLSVKITDNGIKLLERGFLEEKFLRKNFPIEVKNLKDEDKFAFDNLIKRKGIIKQHIQKVRNGILTDIGKSILARGISTGDIADALTVSMLRDNSWKNKKFRRYDIKINVPKVFGGKRHFVNQAIEYARKIWLDMGFKEMEGPLINTSFWNFDSLFVAQDHPVRDLQDTYFLRKPEKGKLPNKKLVNAVKAAHENGFGTGSTGWGYGWSEEEAKKLVLRTHTTVLSAKTLAALKDTDLPAKFFSFGKCFRNETVDWSHLFEFNQTEGIVVDPNANFKHLLGYLKEFFRKMGYPQARFRPAYFPYTEMSLEIDVYHPQHKKWMELGGAGIFRPEVVVPLLGKDIPVLAWGPGFDRIIMNYYNLNDLRDLYKNDLKQLREMKIFFR